LGSQSRPQGNQQPAVPSATDAWNRVGADRPRIAAGNAQFAGRFGLANWRVCVIQCKGSETDDPDIPLLLSVPGVRWVLAFTPAAEIEQIARFSSPRTVAGPSRSRSRRFIRIGSPRIRNRCAINPTSGSGIEWHSGVASSMPERRIPRLYGCRCYLGS
jgi:hypothetical protein